VLNTRSNNVYTLSSDSTTPLLRPAAGFAATADDTQTISWADFRTWERQLASSGNCTRPIWLRGGPTSSTWPPGRSPVADRVHHHRERAGHAASGGGGAHFSWQRPGRYRDGKRRRNYAGTARLTRASGRKKTVTARLVHNRRLADALHAQAFSALSASPGARAFPRPAARQWPRHNDTLRRLANRLVGILHGCLKTRTLHNEDTPGPTGSSPPLDALSPWNV
jgi:hypothetical protein